MSADRRRRRPCITGASVLPGSARSLLARVAGERRLARACLALDDLGDLSLFTRVVGGRSPGPDARDARLLAAR